MAMSLAPLAQRLQTTLTLPVLIKEMRTRMRGTRTPVLLFIATGITIGVALFILMPQWENYTGDPTAMRVGMSAMGSNLFIGLMIIEAVLCALFAPALTAGAISAEREQQTLDLLLLTRLSPMNIIIGKLISSLSFILVVLLCALPVAAISFLLGGVSPAQLGWSLVMILAAVLNFGCMGVYASSRFQKTATSVTVAYGAGLLWMALIWIFALLLSIVDYTNWRNGADTDGISMAYVAVAVLISAVLGIIPSTIFSIIITRVLRRPLARASNIILWLGSAVLILVPMLAAASLMKDYLSSNWYYWLIGNPIFGMMLAITGPEDFLNGSIPKWVLTWHLPMTIGVQVLSAWVFLLLTGDQLKKIRE
jgi:ABC-type transport system involved in multi-copper enzyme maturation permease subunit